ncbi:MAG TPA: D-alanyl-D-alanine carboxypeptidase/D-alanyl-D-alanine-endopeptidase [Vicinamibacteria bacterium]
MKRCPGLPVLTGCLLVAAVAAGGEADPASLRRGLEEVLEREALRPVFWGVEVRSLKTGAVLFSRNAAKAFRPASTLKLVTTAAALDTCGPEERLRTTIETAGRLDATGRILGDLFLVGRGDSTLGGGRYGDGQPLRPFEAMADALRASGVKVVEGRVVGHEGLFAGERRGSDWGWEDLTWSYGAEVSALSFNDNAVGLKVSPGERPNDPAVVELAPPSRYYRVLSSVVTTPPGSKTELRLTRDAGANLIRLSGAIARGSEAWQGWVALEDPARFAATVFTEVLEARGIRVTGDTATSGEPLPAGRRELAVHEGPTMAELIRIVNKESRNLQAEALLRLLGARLSGEGSTAAGRIALDEFLRRTRVRTEGWGIEDGSGLARSNVVTPEGLVDLLVVMDKHPHAAAFRASLPVAGADGTLKTRMRETPAEGRLQAKTGTLALVNGLAGYVTNARGERLAFAALANGQIRPAEAQAALDAIGILLAR